MAAKNPAEICELFRRGMAAGDLESLLGLYDPGAVFLDQSGETRKGREGLRGVLAPLAAAKSDFQYTILQIIEAGDIALMHTEWTVSGAEPMHSHAIEVARRQPDGTWCWLIGDPFTVGRVTSEKRRAA